jgi:hypothetical protein
MSRALKPYAPRTLALLVAAAFAGHAYANTGRVEFVFGGATLRNAQGDRPLTRGVDLRTGDAVITTDGRVQIRFSDGAFVSLQPNTEFKIDDYRFDGQTDGSERGIFGLAKGAMRTVTGLVGRVNRRSYEVRTPTATVGIRGTGGIISILLDLSTLVRGTSGIWTLANLSGVTFDVPAGRAGLAGTDQSQSPRETGEAPSAPPAPPAEQPPAPPISQAENRTSTGGSVVLQDTGVPIGLVFADTLNLPFVLELVNTEFIGILQDGTVSLLGFPMSIKGNIGSAGQLSGFTFAETTTGDSFKFTFAGTLNESNSNGTVSWGRWTGPVTLSYLGQSETLPAWSSNGGFHYAIGVPTAQMPTIGSFDYTMIGATAPTIQNESLAPGRVTQAYFNGNFTPAGGNVYTYVYYDIGGKSWWLNASGSITGNSFTGSGNNYFCGPGCSPCSSSCGAQITGGFAGTGAAFAGLAYKGQVASGSNIHNGGVVVFGNPVPSSPR